MLTSRATCITSNASDDGCVGELRLLEIQLSNLPDIPLQDQTELPPEHAISELYRLACLIHVKKILDPDLLYNFSEVQQLLAQFISLLDRLPPTAPANGILCWPLVVAGMASAVATHRRLIIGRLRAIYETWRSEILSKSAALLYDFWKDDKDEVGSCSRTVHLTLPRGEAKLKMGQSWFHYPIVLL